MKRAVCSFWSPAIGAAAIMMCASVATASTSAERISIPYVVTRTDTVHDMLWMAGVGKEDVLYDLGCGDGRIVIAAVKEFGARRGVGVDNDSNRIRESRENAKKAGVEGRVEFIEADLFKTDFSEASVVTSYLGHGANIQLRAKMLSLLKPGSRIVSHKFGMGEWQPDKQLTARTAYLGMTGQMWGPFSNNPHVPSYTENEPIVGRDKIMMWVVPAPVAGVWRGTIKTASGEHECRLILQQKFSTISGGLEITDVTKPFRLMGEPDPDVRLNMMGGGAWMPLDRPFAALAPPIAQTKPFSRTFARLASDSTEVTAEIRLPDSDGPTETAELRNALWVQADLWGDHVRFVADMLGPLEVRFDGHVENDLMRGTLVVREDGKIEECLWQAKRDKVELAGTWEMWCGIGLERTPVKLRIERRDGLLAAYCLYQEKEMPLTDFYDFGGGVYFTYLIGKEDGGFRIAEDTGWLIGQGVVIDGKMRGTVTFYSSESGRMPGMPRSGSGG